MKHSRLQIGQGHFFQNLDGRPDHDVWRTEMALADRAEDLGFDSGWAFRDVKR